MDRLIVLAYDRYEGSLCPKCAQDRARSFNPAMAGRYQVHGHTCYGCSALEQVESKQKDAKGVKNYVVDAGPEDLPIHRFSLAPIDQDEYNELAG